MLRTRNARTRNTLIDCRCGTEFGASLQGPMGASSSAELAAGARNSYTGASRRSRRAEAHSVRKIQNKESLLKARIYHNPRCSKSRQTLELLEQRKIDLDIVEYLKTPPTKAELKALLRKLGLRAADIVRTNEPEYREAAPENPTDDELLDLIVAHPKLLQRPIVVAGDRARIGRPPEQV